MTLFFRFIAILIVTLPAAISCKATRESGLPKASPDASHTLVLHANEHARWWVDGEEVGEGRMIKVLVNGEPHKIAAKAKGYVLKEEFARPPYDASYPIRITFMVGDQERWHVDAEQSAPEPAKPAPGPAPPPLPAVKGVPRIWTIAIGVSKFAEPSIALEYADRDAKAVDAFFASKAGGAVPATRRALLTNDQATRAEVLTVLRSFAKRSAPDDMLVLFLATHGVPDSGGDLYFLTHDTSPKQLVGTGLPQRDLEYVLSKAGARRIVFFADACHAGAAGFAGFKGTRALELSETNRLIGRIAKTKPGMAVFTASSASETSREAKKWGGGHGVFSHYLLEGLAGPADANGDGFVSIRELYDHTYEQVSKATGGDQHPELKGTFDNRMPISEVTK